MVQSQKPQSPVKIPKLPPWLDYHSFSLKKQNTVFSVIRIVIAVCVCIYCGTCLAIFELDVGEKYIYILGLAYNVFHFLVTIYFLCNKLYLQGDVQVLRLWADIEIGALGIILIALVPCIPSINIWTLLRGVQLIIISGLPCVRVYWQSRQLPYQPQTNTTQREEVKEGVV